MFCSRCGTKVADGSKFCPSCGLDLSSVTPLAAKTGQSGERTEEDVVREALKDEYEIIGELGRGGMAIVFHGRDKHLDREVAIKVLPFSLAFDAEFVERFQREARTAAKLEHPNIIPIYRVGRSGRVIYFVMKFLRGASLSDVLQKRGRLPPVEIRKLLIDTASALGYAHQNGVVHRDIKPDNIMFDESGRAVVTDFGIAKAGTGTRLTGTGMVIGTPHYMSPEQVRAQPLDGRSDIYSLGIVAYQCLVGAVPFDGEDAFSIGYKHITEPLPEPELKTADEVRLFGIIRRMTAKAPEDRYQTAEELLAALEGRPFTSVAQEATIALQSAPTAVIPTGASMGRPSTPTTPIPKAGPRPATEKKKRGGLLVGLFLLLLLGGGGGGAYYYFVELGGEWPPAIGQRLGTVEPPVTGEEPLPVPRDTEAVSDSVAVAADTASASVTLEQPAQPLPPTGRLILQGLPARAKVTIDGQEVDRDTLILEPGSKRVVVNAPGYEQFSATVAVARGADTTLVVRMRRAQPEPAREPARREVEDYCSAPGPNYNRDGACYDAPPRALAAPLVPIDDRIQGMPSPAILWVLVSAEGRALRVEVAEPSDNPVFTRYARGFALTLLYNPAQKNGQPVEGWVQMRFVPRRNP
ncbi:Serine/threonine-protein kinase PrkC [bacterium HR33]|nr:Serine/threonine-protein kinase PrkC [bacterium HR33]